MVVWNATVESRPGAEPCKVPSPTEFEYPSSYSVQPMRSVAGFGAAADAWSEGKDGLSTGTSYKYAGGVVLPDGRVVLVPDNANHVGLYDPSTDGWSEGKDDLSAAGSVKKYWGGVLLPDGRVVLVPSLANHVGLYDGGATRSGAAYTVDALSPAVNALLLPYYNKF